MTNPVVGIDVENDRDDTMAMQMVKDLCAAYPGRSWFVTIKGGIIQIKDMDMSVQWGMVLHYSQIKDDAAARKKQVLMAAGEFLERASKKLGRLTLEGVKAAPGALK